MCERRLPCYPSVISTLSRIFCLSSQIDGSHLPETERGLCSESATDPLTLVVH